MVSGEEVDAGVRLEKTSFQRRGRGAASSRPRRTTRLPWCQTDREDQSTRHQTLLPRLARLK
jgi:hypothetical protein